MIFLAVGRQPFRPEMQKSGPPRDIGQFGLLDGGECLLDNVEVRSGTSGSPR